VLCYNITVGNFMVYQDPLETSLLQLFVHPENSEWFSIISVVTLRSTMLRNRNKHNL